MNYGGLCTDQTGLDGNISPNPLFADPAATTSTFFQDLRASTRGTTHRPA